MIRSTFIIPLYTTLFFFLFSLGLMGQVMITQSPDPSDFNCVDGAPEWENGVENWINDYIAADNATTMCSSGSNITWTHDYDENNPSYQSGDGCDGTIIVEFTATDECGNFETVDGEITVQDFFGPSFLVSPEDTVTLCDGSADVEEQFNDWLNNILNLPLVDDCSPANELTISYSCNQCPLQADFFCDVVVDVEFMLTDPCGNEEVHVAFFNVEMPEPPLSPPTISSHTFTCDGMGNTDDINDLIANDLYFNVEPIPCDGSLPTLMTAPDLESYNFMCGETASFTVWVEDVCGMPSEMHEIDITLFEASVSFITASETLNEDVGVSQVCLAITGAHPTVDTEVEVSLSTNSTATNGTDYNTLSEVQDFVFPAGSEAIVCFDVSVIDDMVVDPGETIIFDITEVSGGYDAIIGDIPTHTLAITDNDDNDEDGVENSVDNCPEVYNPLQEDIDGDGLGNVCDSDNYVAPLSIVEGNIYIDQAYSGLIVQSPDGNCWIITVGNDGSLQTVALECP